MCRTHTHALPLSSHTHRPRCIFIKLQMPLENTPTPRSVSKTHVSLYTHTYLMNRPLCFFSGCNPQVLTEYILLHSVSVCECARMWARVRLLRRMFCSLSREHSRIRRSLSEVWNCTVIRFTCQTSGGGGAMAKWLRFFGTFFLCVILSPTNLFLTPLLEICIWVLLSSVRHITHHRPSLSAEHLFLVRAREGMSNS